MTPPTPEEIRELILTVARDMEPKSLSDGSMQHRSLFDGVSKRLGLNSGMHLEIEREILTQWHDLIRTGFFAWGLNIGNPDPPFFHFTDRGRRSLEQLSRDPGNPAGYMRYLNSVATLNPIAESYVTEGLACFEAGLFKAAAVMVGGASESLIIDLRDLIAAKLSDGVPKSFGSRSIKGVVDGLRTFFDMKKGGFPRELQEEFEYTFLAFAQQIRASRNDAGHPSSVEPVTEVGVHASFLIFPELAKLSNRLAAWVTDSLK